MSSRTAILVLALWISVGVLAIRIKPKEITVTKEVPVVKVQCGEQDLKKFQDALFKEVIKHKHMTILDSNIAYVYGLEKSVPIDNKQEEKK